MRGLDSGSPRAGQVYREKSGPAVPDFCYSQRPDPYFESDTLANPVRRALLAVEKRARLMLPRPELWQGVAVVAVNTVLVIVLARSLAALSLAVVSGRSSPVVEMTAPATPGAAANGSASAPSPTDYAAIAGWHLFGRAEAGRPVKTPPAVMPATPLNLRLVGVFYVERGADRALALIAAGGGPERGYRMGEPLPGGARLARIQRDHVVVFRNGRREALNLPKSDESNRTPAPSAPPGVLAAPVPESGAATFTGPQVIDASAIAGRLRNEAPNRPQALEDIAFASPYVQNGQFVGFRLRPGRDRQLFQQLGLNGGDVLTEINGTRLNSLAQGLAVLQELLGASRIDVRVLRNGAEIPITFSLDGPSPNERD